MFLFTACFGLIFTRTYCGVVQSRKGSQRMGENGKGRAICSTAVSFNTPFGTEDPPSLKSEVKLTLSYRTKHVLQIYRIGGSPGECPL